MELPAVLDQLEDQHGEPRRPPPETALDWVLWVNVAYLVPDERRARAYAALRKATDLAPARILALAPEELLELAGLGGMKPEARAQKLLDIAQLVQEQFDGDLQAVLALPVSRARSALRKFPGIGAPGADTILLFTGTRPVAALESNGLRSLVRLGLAVEGKSYAATYRSAMAAFEPHLERGCSWLARAHLLLKEHGREPCKNSAPHCEACALAAACPSAQ